jgi:hypothetical protein
MATAPHQSPCSCMDPWRYYPRIVAFYTAVPERGLFVATWWVRDHGLCRTKVVRLGQDTCLVCSQRHWCGRGRALHTWVHDTAQATVGGLGEVHAWTVVQVRSGQVPHGRPTLLRPPP